jgi:uncharacterized protein (DUF924 family)
MAQQEISMPQAVIAFWQDAGPERWFRSDAQFDALCLRTFEALWLKAVAGELDDWRQTPEGALALVLLLDQFPRNMFRATAKAYASDSRARDVASDALARGFEKHVPPALRRFFHLPFSHSEDAADQERAVRLAEASGEPDALKWARHHRDVIARFGRFPHRNAILSRDSTPAEQEWMAGEDAFKG